MKDIIIKFLGYRLHIPILAFVILMTTFRAHFTFETVMIALCFSSGIAGWYLSNKYSDFREDGLNKASIAVSRDNSLLCAFLIAYIAPLFYLYQSIPLLVLYLCGPVFLGSLYNFPIFKNGKRLKNLFVLKNLTASFVWASVFTFPSYIYMDDFAVPAIAGSFLSYFLIVLAIEIFTDIRDVEGDLQSGIATIPNRLGVLAAKAIATLCMVIAALKFVLWGSGAPCFIAAYLICILLILIAHPKRGVFFFQSIIFVWIAANLINLIINGY